ncbi:hypothetical protein FNYG_08708 [Fusarium nygamai]|uniref:Mitochondrial import protein 1 n=15 Tax=Fusarium TaxID=5506 RepID=A0A2K0W6T8_GIBNY|nr:hypothetical protein FNYG_08708 [Fusarium nygamai]
MTVEKPRSSTTSSEASSSRQRPTVELHPIYSFSFIRTSAHISKPAMSDEHNHLAESGVTLHSDSELYSAGDDLSSPPSSNSPVILYKPPTVWSLIRGAAINLLLPFVNGMMLGFGELFAHEAAFRLGWGGTKVFPLSRRRVHPIGPGIELREKSYAPRPSLDDFASLE